MNPNLREQLHRAQIHLERRNRGEDPPLPVVPSQPGVETFNRTKSDIVIPAPEELHYYEFQRAGVEFLASHTTALLCDDMGLGKSVQICGLLNYDLTLRSCLIVCPASMKLCWHRELSKWLCDSRKLSIADSGNKAGADSDIVIVNYDILTKLERFLSKRIWDLVVFDEGHFLKSPTAQRTIAAKALCARKKVILSGTPMLNRPAELWSLLNLLEPACWPNFYRFAHRYCAPVKASWGWDFSGASNQRELALLLRSRLMLRRRKKDVLPQLPPITRQVVPLSVDTSPLLKSLTEKLAKLFGFDPLHPPFKIDPEKIPFELISAIRRETGTLKVAQAIEFIREETSAYQHKCVVFAHHLDVLDALQNAFEPHSVLVTGESSANMRQKAIDTFQTDEAVRYFIASTRAMGLGITLTAASHAIFVEADWTPAILEQAEARLVRIGQKASSALAQYLVVENSIDEKIFAAVQEKMAVINQIIPNA
jgi:SWI/SNF-related matrix-associated actin-dependent regulator 1 of chromatin subfamily A